MIEFILTLIILIIVALSLAVLGVGLFIALLVLGKELITLWKEHKYAQHTTRPSEGED